MFGDFLYLLRKSGLKVSMTEWMALQEALDKGLHASSFTGFYHLCRALLVKSEADFDCFDRCFLAYFKDVDFQQEISQELMDWLDKPDVLTDYANYDEEQALRNLGLSEEEIEAKLAAGTPYVIRQKMPKYGKTTFKDEVFGEISVENAILDDNPGFLSRNSCICSG